MEHPEIPVGLYCYDGWRKDENGKMRQGRICPHWQRTENGARCNLINREDHTYCGFHLIWDQVKECGINEGRDDDYTPPTKEEQTARCIREGFELKVITCECGTEMEVWHKGRKDGDTRK